MKWEYVLKTSTKKIVSNVCVYKQFFLSVLSSLF